MTIHAQQLAMQLLRVFQEVQYHPQDVVDALHIAEESIRQSASLFPPELKAECDFLKGMNKIPVGFTSTEVVKG